MHTYLQMTQYLQAQNLILEHPQKLNRKAVEGYKSWNWLLLTSTGPKAKAEDATFQIFVKTGFALESRFCSSVPSLSFPKGEKNTYISIQTPPKCFGSWEGRLRIWKVQLINNWECENRKGRETDSAVSLHSDTWLKHAESGQVQISHYMYNK